MPRRARSRNLLVSSQGACRVTGETNVVVAVSLCETPTTHKGVEKGGNQLFRDLRERESPYDETRRVSADHLAEIEPAARRAASAHLCFAVVVMGRGFSAWFLLNHT